MADNPSQPIKYKAFYNKIINNHTSIKKEKQGHRPLQIVSKASKEVMYNQFLAIKQQALDIVDAVLEDILNDPGKKHLILKK